MEAYTVVDPRTVVVHLHDAPGADAAVVSAVGFHQHAAIAVTDGTGHGPAQLIQVYF